MSLESTGAEAWSNDVLRAVGEAAACAGSDVSRCGMVALSDGRPVGGWAHIATLLSSLAEEGVTSEKLARALDARHGDIVPVVVLAEVTGGPQVVVMRQRRLA